MEPPRDEQASDASEQEPGEQLPLVELETLLTRRSSWRKRLAQVALALVVAATAGAALRGTVLPSGVLTNTSAPQQVSATLVSNVNFGTLTVNGTRVSKPPPLTTSIPVKGTSVITLNAPPFRPYTCRFTDLTMPTDDPIHCLLNYEETSAPDTSSLPSGRFTETSQKAPESLVGG